jgi:PadR family transcriptional regulator PadR
MENTFRIGRFEELALRAVWHLGEKAYGIPIRQEIADRTGREYSVGAIYTALDRLEQKGFVTSRLGDPTPERGGRAKKYFRIEADGIRALNNSQDMVAAMGGLIHVG